ncbi:ABC transporter substrate-binding protein [Aquabacter cavernae]|uniref:ABC transporter substrate-binding protein n=1 Tax=Aquabacter cavernae TaxID=2496029 RepID=UPI000F8E7393|nr:ABC transporter substrate-binding protein [Aquabacter cavernae]
MHILSRRAFALALAAGIGAVSAPAARAETDQIRIAKQYGLAYLPLMVMEKEKLYEKRAAELGIPTKPVYLTLGNNTAANEALISGNLDVITNGPPGFLIFWGRTKGTRNEVKGIAPLLSQSMWLNTRDPNVKSIKDFTEKDRIALTAVKNSTPAILLQMAAAKEYGPAEFAKLDPLTVSLSHPDGMSSLLSGKTEITAHFTSPPFQNMEVKTPGIRTILTSEEVMGGPSTFNLLFTTSKFDADNPKAIEALVKALDDAQKLITADKEKAADIYIEMSNAKNTPKAEVVELLSDPTTVYSLTPQKFMAFAKFLNSIGTLKTAPTDWKDLFLPYIHDQPGN